MKRLSDIPNARLSGLDALRFLAAAGVMVAHYGDVHYATWTLAWHFLGAFCVNVFFVISGLVIMRSAGAASSVGEFLSRRASRLFPAFIICLLFAVMVRYVRHETVSGVEFLGNLTMVPNLLKVTPICGAYWTLSNEWSFYLMISLVFYGLRRYQVTIMVLWVMVGLVIRMAAISDQTANTLLNTGFAPLFAAGMVIHLLKSRKIDAAKAAVVFVAMLVASAGGPWGGAPWPGLMLAAAYLLCFVLCVAIVVAAAGLRLPAGMHRLAIIAGAASYPLYLIHAPVADLVTPALVSLGLNSHAVMASIILSALVLSLVVSQKLEEPLRRVLVGGARRARAGLTAATPS